MRTVLERLLVWLAFAAYLATGAFAVEGVQLCLEPDGHVSLEVVASGCGDCCEQREGEHGTGARVESCPCVDISLGVLVAPFTRTKSDGECVAALPCGGWRELVRVARVSHALPAPPHVLKNSPVELVRSVVLRV
jgi:hypothetical protein